VIYSYIGAKDIAVTDHGDSAPNSGEGTTAHTYTGLSSDGPYTVVMLTYQDNSNPTISSSDWNGTSGTLLVQKMSGTADPDNSGCAIIIFPGACTGDLVITFASAVSDSYLTYISLAGLKSSTPVDTDSDGYAFGSSASCDLDNLASPGAGGIRLALWARFTTGTPSNTWTNATALALADAGNWEHSAAYDSGDDGTTITPSNATLTNTKAIVGVSLR